MRYFGFKKRSFGLKTIGWAGSTASALADLFKNGEQGVWLDPSDLKTMFQDVSGATPVTKDGDPVALIRDKSGNNNHATQPTASARPIYRTDGILHWLEFDGTDDFLFIAGQVTKTQIVISIAFDFKDIPTGLRALLSTNENDNLLYTGATGSNYAFNSFSSQTDVARGEKAYLSAYSSSTHSSYKNKAGDKMQMGSLNTLNTNIYIGAKSTRANTRLNLYHLCIVDSAVAYDNIYLDRMGKAKAGLPL